MKNQIKFIKLTSDSCEKICITLDSLTEFKPEDYVGDFIGHKQFKGSIYVVYDQLLQGDYNYALEQLDSCFTEYYGTCILIKYDCATGTYDSLSEKDIKDILVIR